MNFLIKSSNFFWFHRKNDYTIIKSIQSIQKLPSNSVLCSGYWDYVKFGLIIPN